MFHGPSRGLSVFINEPHAFELQLLADGIWWVIDWEVWGWSRGKNHTFLSLGGIASHQNEKEKFNKRCGMWVLVDLCGATQACCRRKAGGQRSYTSWAGWSLASKKPKCRCPVTVCYETCHSSEKFRAEALWKGKWSRTRWDCKCWKNRKKKTKDKVMFPDSNFEFLF